jgi:hypothetical protein
MQQIATMEVIPRVNVVGVNDAKIGNVDGGDKTTLTCNSLGTGTMCALSLNPEHLK